MYTSDDIIIRDCTRCGDSFIAKRVCQKQCDMCEDTDITQRTDLTKMLGERWGEVLVGWQGPNATPRKAKQDE